MDYIAHIRQKDGIIQSVLSHLREVQAGSERRGAKAGVQNLAGMAGLLHDAGKYTIKFRTYIQQAAANPHQPPKRGSVDHSTAGGKLVYEYYHQPGITPQEKLAAEWIANCIISHHQGLRDYFCPEADSPFLERVAVKTEGLEEYPQAVKEVFRHISKSELDELFARAVKEVDQLLSCFQNSKQGPIAFTLITKFIFSCLIDADRTNTRQFEEGEKIEEPDYRNTSVFEQAYQKLMEYIKGLEHGTGADHPINRLRRQMSEQCGEFATRPSHIYTLSIPTGGGKTLASLRYALRHAMEYNKERIIYVVPYTTIIEQNAQDVRDILCSSGILDDDLILEHHSNVVEEREDEEDEDDYDVRKQKLKLARDTWDRPIIFTTMVQFLNTLYAKGTRNTRRLHQLANSVIIFDEVQSVPINCVSLFNASLNFLSTAGQSCILLCTATQPALTHVKHGLQLAPEPEIIKDLSSVIQAFERVKVHDQTIPEGWRAEQTASFVWQQMEQEGQSELISSILIILNTKTAVRKLYERLAEDIAEKDEAVKLFHLSTNMCPAHRKSVLKEVKDSLSAGIRVICVSTQLIEAGVNISFDCVVRSLAGLDSIAQAAGRCNRHGKDKLRHVYIIRSADESLTHLPDIKTGANQTERILHEFYQNPSALEHSLLSATSMKRYFQYYYSAIENKLDYWVKELDKHLYPLLGLNKDYYTYFMNARQRAPGILSRPAIATAEKYFEVIESGARTVLVPYGEAGYECIMDLNGELEPTELEKLLRRSQQYGVNLFEREWRQLEQAGDIYPLFNGQVWALRETAYSDRFGVGSDGTEGWSFGFT